DASGCTKQATFTIIDTLEVSGVVDQNNIAVFVAGGAAPYSYLWNDGATTKDRTGLPPGNYTITVTDVNDSTDQAVFTILPAGNTGFKAWETLEEYYVGSGVATGREKPNEPADPDYVAPLNDPVSCPI
ncbi:MAG: hypothetical protein HC831_26430, partial [Chloroflexia bacterium]|nr:hypothetical protein [Chloroflexia bacterium]